MLDKLISNFILIDLFVGVAIYILAAFIGVYLKRNKEFMTPVIFGLMYGNYISIRSLLSNK